MSKKIMFILNSDFGAGNTIGMRALPIAESLGENKVEIYCRDFNLDYNHKFKIVKVVPLGKLIMQFLTGIQIYISKKIPTNSIKRNIFEYFLLKKLKKIDLSKIDLIHSWDFLPKVYGYIKIQNPNIKIIQDVPIAFPEILDKIDEKLNLFSKEELVSSKDILNSFEYIDNFLVPSSFVKDSLRIFNIQKNKIKIVPFGVDINKFKPRKSKSNIFRVCFSGNVNNRKGLKYLIKAWKELNLENAELNIYGRVYPEVNKYLVNKERFNIKTHGFVNLKEELNKNHIFVFPSLMEGSAKAVYEALSCGLPVITTYNSGSIAKDKKEGFIIPIQNVESIKKAILYFYNNKDELKKFSKKARETAKKFTWKNYGLNVVINYNLK